MEGIYLSWIEYVSLHSSDIQISIVDYTFYFPPPSTKAKNINMFLFVLEWMPEWAQRDP